MVKNVVSRYIHNGSPVLGCFLGASKAFDLIDHSILFDTLMKRGLPFPIVRFLASWYSMQKMQVRWDKSLSEPFSVSNGVRQGSVLSPHLFAVILIACCWICVIQVLAVTGGVLLLVLLAMLMIWFYLLLVLLL